MLVAWFALCCAFSESTSELHVSLQEDMFALAIRHAAALPTESSSDPSIDPLSGSRRLQEPTATSERRHNGKEEERVINATWQCTFPKGDCFSRQARKEGTPDNLKSCVKQENLAPLTIKFTVDLTCAKIEVAVPCDKLTKMNFDPFEMCNNDPKLLSTRCQFACKGKRYVEECIYDLDTAGLYNMSDETVDACSLQETCMSPYVEQNQLFCSGHETTNKFKPHWFSREERLPDSSEIGLSSNEVPAVQQGSAGRGHAHFVGLTFIALLLLVGSLVSYAGCSTHDSQDGKAQRACSFVLGCLEHGRSFVDRRCRSFSRIGGGYVAPDQSIETASSYTAPAMNI